MDDRDVRLIVDARTYKDMKDLKQQIDEFFDSCKRTYVVFLTEEELELLIEWYKVCASRACEFEFLRAEEDKRLLERLEGIKDG